MTLVIEGTQRDVCPWQCIPLPFGNICAHTVVFPRSLPYLSRRRTHNQTSITMDKCTNRRKYEFPDPCLLNFFLVFVGTTTSQNIRNFLTPCIYIKECTAQRQAFHCKFKHQGCSFAQMQAFHHKLRNPCFSFTRDE